MFKAIVFALIIFMFPSVSHAKYVYEYFAEIEPLLKNRDFISAQENFDKLDKDIKYYSVKGTGKFIKNLFDDTVLYLKEADSVRSILEKANSNLGNYEAHGDYSVSLKGCQGRNCDYVTINSFQSHLPKKLPFSSEFIAYINEYNKSTIELFKKTNLKLTELKQLEQDNIKKERERQRALEEEKRLKKQEAERLAQEAAAEKDRKIRENEILNIDKASKQKGLKGFSKQNIVSLIYNTQQKGGLENYINTSVGCSSYNQRSCEKWYPKIKAIQVLDQGVLYSFSEYANNDVFSFVIFVEKEPGHIYQDGQSLENSFYKFNGIISYETVLGNEKSVPFFSKVQLSY